jgi:mannose-1-phosphate guanylyltransferase
LTQIISGDERPKQFCPMLNGQTLLAHAIRRAELTVPREQLLVSLTRPQSEWYMQESVLRSTQRVVQPSNRGTAPPIVHSLLSISQMDEDAVVGIFPSDHHYSDEPLFAAQLESAFANATEHPDTVVLLGARPDSPETGFGWIELDSAVGQHGELHRVKGFQEKPCEKIARKLLRQGALWNTFVMVGRVTAFLEMIQAALWELTEIFCMARLWKGEETHIEQSLYEQIPAMDFSRQVLSPATAHLSVMRLGDVGWNDLGDPERVLAVARAAGPEPMWAAAWRRTMCKPAKTADGDLIGSLPALSQMASA